MTPAKSAFITPPFVAAHRLKRTDLRVHHQPILRGINFRIFQTSLLCFDAFLQDCDGTLARLQIRLRLRKFIGSPLLQAFQLLFGLRDFRFQQPQLFGLVEFFYESQVFLVLAKTELFALETERIRLQLRFRRVPRFEKFLRARVPFGD